MKGLPQNVLLNFRLEIPKSDLTIYLPSGISEIFCQMVNTPVTGYQTLEIKQTKIQPMILAFISRRGVSKKPIRALVSYHFLLQPFCSQRNVAGNGKQKVSLSSKVILMKLFGEKIGE